MGKRNWCNTMSEDQFVPFHTTDLTGKRVLVLAPHPDDETIGCGGSLALHIAAGDPVKVVFLTNGAKGDMTGRFERQFYLSLRQEEARKACDCLGRMELEFWPYEDRELGVSPGVQERIGETLKIYAPDLVYVPSPLEFHPDHRAASAFLCRAVQLYDRSCDIAFCEISQPLRVNRLVDITSVLKQKTRALRIYQSQLDERPYDEVAIALNRFRSMTLPEGVTHAEGFSLWPVDKLRQAAYIGCSLLAERFCQNFL